MWCFVIEDDDYGERRKVVSSETGAKVHLELYSKMNTAQKMGQEMSQERSMKLEKQETENAVSSAQSVDLMQLLQIFRINQIDLEIGEEVEAAPFLSDCSVHSEKVFSSSEHGGMLTVLGDYVKGPVAAGRDTLKKKKT